MEKILKKNLEVLERLEQAFQSSINRVKKLNISQIKSFEEYEPIDAFFDRFERLIDNLFQSTFRTLYFIENREQPKTLLDLSSYIVKVKIAPDIDTLISLKDLRNKIAHEYISLGIYNTESFINMVLEKSNDLFKIIKNVKAYSRKFI